jgi:hypothetical protein
MNEDDGTRTRNRRIDSPIISCSKPNQDKKFAVTDSAGRSAGRSEGADEGGIPDVELARLVAVWPILPEPIRRAIMAMIEAAK